MGVVLHTAEELGDVLQPAMHPFGATKSQLVSLVSFKNAGSVILKLVCFVGLGY